MTDEQILQTIARGSVNGRDEAVRRMEQARTEGDDTSRAYWNGIRLENELLLDSLYNLSGGRYGEPRRLAGDQT